MTTGTTPSVRILPEKLAEQRLHSTVQAVYDVLKKAGDATLNGGDKRSFQKLTSRCETLTDLLLSIEQKQSLESLNAGSELAVHAALCEHEIPWELLRINGQFLCERFACGRIVSDLPHGHLQASAGTNSTLQRANVLIADARDLVSTNSEKTIVERRLRQISHDAPNLIQIADTLHNPLTRNNVLEVLQRSSWLHFAGHATPVDEQRVLCLNEQRHGTGDEDTTEQLTPEDLQVLDTGPEVVFLNACGALQHVGSDQPLQLPTFVSEFLRLGTRWLIGPVVPVLDRQTRHFVSEFYALLVQGCSMGEAMRGARIQARQDLGPFSLLPFSYVLYGIPSESPFPIRDTMSTPAKTLKPDLRQISYPCDCSLCGQLVQTRHGLGNEMAVTLGTPPVCRRCHRGINSDVAREHRFAFAEAALPRVSGHGSGTAKRKDLDIQTQLPVISAAEMAFRNHLEECLSREVSWLDLKTGQRIFGEVQSLAPAPRHRHRLSELDHRTDTIHGEWQTHRICNRQGQPIAYLTFLLLPKAASPGEFTGRRATTVSVPQLTRIGEELKRLDHNLQHYCFVCSQQEFSNELLEQLQSELAPVWYPSGVSLYLHSVADERTWFRESDLAAHHLAGLLQRQSTAQQFHQALIWVQSQLPLVTSVSCINIVDELKLESDAVEAAMRCVAVQEQLLLESTADFGLVLSAPDTCRSNQRLMEVHSSWAQRLLHACLAPLTAIRRWISG